MKEIKKYKIMGKRIKECRIKTGLSVEETAAKVEKLYFFRKRTQAILHDILLRC